MAAAGGEILHFGFTDFCMGRCGYFLDSDAAINNRIVVHCVVVDDGGLIVNLRYLRAWEFALPKIVVREIMHRNKSKMVWAQSEVEADLHAHSIVTPARTRV